MGPQFFHCGNRPSCISGDCLDEGFNGAAVLSLRKWGVGAFFAVQRGRLQWGRSSFTAEIPYPTTETIAARIASMGPQFFHCGNKYRRTTVDTNIHASMGPQFFHCGNPSFCMISWASSSGFNGAAVLSLRK